MSLTPGKMDVDNVAVVSIRPAPKCLPGPLGAGEFEGVAGWVSLNEAALLDYWNETIDTAELLGRLVRAPA